MSFRGGRGGRRGGGGLGGRAGPLTEEERNATHYSFPTETYPKANVPLAAKASRAERLAASHFLAFRTEVREGPLFTGNLGAGKRGGSGSAASKQAHQNKQVVVMEIGFEGLGDGIKRYTDRYHKKRKVGRSIDEHPYVVDFFPKELHTAMGIQEGTTTASADADSNDKANRKRKFVAKRLDVAKFTESLRKTEMPTSIEELLQLEADSNGALDADARARAIESIKAAQKDGSNKTAAGKGQEEEEEEDGNKSESDMDGEMEDDFDEDDDDDYNAEKYFDDGEGGDDDDANDEAAY